MEELFQALGLVALVLLVAVGLLAGWLASLAAGGHTGRYLAIGMIGALAAPVLVAALGIAALAAYGLAAILVVALVGAVIVLLVAKLIFD